MCTLHTVIMLCFFVVGNNFARLRDEFPVVLACRKISTGELPKSFFFQIFGPGVHP
jgi:hypothetical protein